MLSGRTKAETGAKTISGQKIVSQRREMVRPDGNCLCLISETAQERRNESCQDLIERDLQGWVQ